MPCLSNGIKTNSDRCITDFLSTNLPPEMLHFNDNQLNDDDTLNIAQALRSNTNLRYLDLHANELTKKGENIIHYQAIFGASRSETSRFKTDRGKSLMYYQSILGLGPSGLKSPVEVNLNSVSGANHTCKILGISRPKAFMNKSSKNSAKSDRGRKLFHVLRCRHRKGCNITHFEPEFSEDCMGLVPHVLACVNTYSADDKSKKQEAVL